ncbi:hypothetical protein QDE92_004705 [Salmonella enterica]|nr:hypothetical protein [Salmonella enterica]
MDKYENRVFYLTDSYFVYDYAFPVIYSIPSEMDGEYVSSFGETLEQLKLRYPDIILITESEALELQAKRKI